MTEPQPQVATQISGSYRETNWCLFPLRTSLIGLGVDVRHPMEDGLTGSVGNTGAAYDTARFTFAEIEREFYRSITSCSVHFLANCRRHEGYVGVNAAREVAWAVSCRRPVVVTHADAVFSADVSPETQALLRRNWPSFVVLAGTPNVRNEFESAQHREARYAVRSRENTRVEAEVTEYLNHLSCYVEPSNSRGDEPGSATGDSSG